MYENFYCSQLLWELSRLKPDSDDFYLNSSNHAEIWPYEHSEHMHILWMTVIWSSIHDDTPFMKTSIWTEFAAPFFASKFKWIIKPWWQKRKNSIVSLNRSLTTINHVWCFFSDKLHYNSPPRRGRVESVINSCANFFSGPLSLIFIRRGFRTNFCSCYSKKLFQAVGIPVVANGTMLITISYYLLSVPCGTTPVLFRGQ